MNDSEILHLLMTRNETALAALQEAYAPLCFSIIRNILPDPRDVEECVSDVYLRVWNTIPPDVPKSLTAYIARIARNAALDRYDYNTADKRSSVLTTSYEELEGCLPMAGVYTDHSVERSEFADLMRQFLKALPAETRICFVRRYWYGQSIREIAAARGLGEEKVKTLLFRTRNKLRLFMNKEDFTL